MNDPCMHTWLRENGISQKEEKGSEGKGREGGVCEAFLLPLLALSFCTDKATLQSFLEQWGGFVLLVHCSSFVSFSFSTFLLSQSFILSPSFPPTETAKTETVHFGSFFPSLCFSFLFLLLFCGPNY